MRAEPPRVTLRELVEGHRHRLRWVVLFIVLSAVEYAIAEAKKHVWARIVAPPQEGQ